MKKNRILALVLVVAILAVVGIAFIAVGCEQQQSVDGSTTNTTLGTLPPNDTTTGTKPVETTDTTTDTTPGETTTDGTETTDTTYPPATVPPVDTETTTDTTVTPIVPSNVKKVLEVGNFPNGDHLLRIEEFAGVRTPCLGHDCPYCAYRNGQTEAVYVCVNADGTVTVCD